MKNKNSEENIKQHEETPDFGTERPSRLRAYFSRGISSFMVVAAGIMFYFALFRMGDISGVFGGVLRILEPIIYGFIIAYLFNPIVEKVEKLILYLCNKKVKVGKRIRYFSRGVGIFVSFFVAVLLLFGLFNKLIPELYNNIKDLAVNLPALLNNLSEVLNDMEFDNSVLGEFARNAIDELSENLRNWFRTDLLRQANSLMLSLTSGVISVVGGLMNVLIGIVIAVYLLFGKEKFLGQSKKSVYALFQPKKAAMIMHMSKKTNSIFGQYLRGVLLDSLLVGVVTFLVLTVMQMPYTLLVSVIVGITNIIPFFGPYIGAVPSAILILLDTPIKGVWFIIFILILQQVDGNIIAPKIIGDTTGLPAFWVIFSTLLGGGLFGFPGMVLGVPAFGVIYYVIKMILEYRLEKKKLPIDSSEYGEFTYLSKEGQLVKMEEKKEKNSEEIKEEKTNEGE